jgi:hypothetical protein
MRKPLPEARRRSKAIQVVPGFFELHRIHSLDYLKVLLAIGVVLAHSILIQNQLVPWSYMLGNGVLRSLVPTFSTLSGYCFFVTYSRGKAGRWLGGLILLYLFWIGFYAPIWVNRDTTAADALQVLLLGTMHLWYVAGLILAAGLLIAFLWLGRRTRTGLAPLLGAALVCALLGTGLAFWAFLHEPGLPLDVSRNGATVIFPFFAFGYALAGLVRDRGLDALPSARTLWLIIAGLFALRLVEAYMSMQAYGVSILSMPELPFLSYPAAVLLFMAFLRLELPEAPVSLSLWSASIYFLHIFLIFVVRHFGAKSLFVYVLVGVTVPVLIAAAFQRLLPRLLPSLRSKRAYR